MPFLCAAQSFEFAAMSCKSEPLRWRHAVLAAAGTRQAAACCLVFVNKLLSGPGDVIAGFGFGCLAERSDIIRCAWPSVVLIDNF